MTDLHTLDREVAGIFARYEALLEHERTPFVPTRDNFEAVLSAIRTAQIEGRRLTARGGDAVTDVLLENIGEVLDSLHARVRTDEQFPNRFVSQLSRKMTAVLGLDPRPEPERADVMGALADRAPAVLDAVAESARRIPEANRETAIRTLNELAAFVTELVSGGFRAALPSAPASQIDALVDRWRAVAGRTKDVVARVRAAAVPVAERRVDGLSYRETLGRVYGIELDELLQWHRDEVERCRERFHATAAAFDASRDASSILETDLGAYGSPDAMFEAMTTFVGRARDRARDYITLPGGETCYIWRVPEYLRDSYPWGGYFSFCSPLLGEPRGAVFLNAHNYRTVTKGWVLLNAIHECYPGHHAHFVKTAVADMPLSFKVAGLISKAAPLTEGIAVRTETLMQDALGEPMFPLFVAYRQLHTSLRIWVDLLLHHFNGSPDAAIDLYVEHMGLSRPVALAQVYSQQLTPGYFTTYYYGLRALRTIQAECGWDDRAFTELIFSCGKVSLGMLRRLLALTAGEREGLTRRFSTGA